MSYENSHEPSLRRSSYENLSRTSVEPPPKFSQTPPKHPSNPPPIFARTPFEVSPILSHFSPISFEAWIQTQAAFSITPSTRGYSNRYWYKKRGSSLLGIKRPHPQPSGLHPQAENKSQNNAPGPHMPCFSQIRAHLASPKSVRISPLPNPCASHFPPNPCACRKEERPERLLWPFYRKLTDRTSRSEVVPSYLSATS